MIIINIYIKYMFYDVIIDANIAFSTKKAKISKIKLKVGYII
jgi:hypothetical protein